jgi:hypothetical protein
MAGALPIWQERMFKVRTLIGEARVRSDCRAGTNKEAVARLERFVDGFASLRPEDINGPEGWKAWVGQYVEPGWMERQHFDDLLSNFGFSEATARAIQATKIDDEKDDGSVKEVRRDESYSK